MIRRFLIFSTIACLLASPIAVYADVVIGNDFLYKNENKAEQIGERHYGKEFVINSPSGYVIPKEEPGSEQGVSTAYSYKGTSPGGRDDKPYTFEGDFFIFKNGEIITITHTYLHKGKYWGVMSYSHTYQPPGWIPIDELLVTYDRQDFETLNKDYFYTYTGGYEAVLNAKKLVEWEWPGSDKEKRIVESYIAERANVLYAYKDRDGREWGKAKYSERWICLSDPENNKIPSFYPALQPTRWSPDGIYDWSAETAIYPPADVVSADNTIYPPADVVSAETAIYPPADVVSADTAIYPPADVVSADTAIYPPADVVSLVISGNINMTLLIISLFVVLLAGVVVLIFILGKRNNRRERND